MIFFCPNVKAFVTPLKIQVFPITTGNVVTTKMVITCPCGRIHMK